MLGQQIPFRIGTLVVYFVILCLFAIVVQIVAHAPPEHVIIFVSAAAAATAIFYVCLRSVLHSRAAHFWIASVAGTVAIVLIFEVVSAVISGFHLMRVGVFFMAAFPVALLTGGAIRLFTGVATRKAEEPA